ncbi:ATP-dependent DNA helicase RuvA [Elstera litoralis]|uniref:Holliday junction branch migration complex subunit RuvA n=1 Tax=Elstera litoralis TaxID=552518 RepID=A0A0F3IT08_9PROT|nr:Holliday junction branch migration protein RuvA [Elstera litoralis]KJV09846.1 ATP-dependent DNA helicase RuvA [Elstera litoralis]
MIAWLKGIVRDLGAGYAVIDVNGVGYLVAASGRTLGTLQMNQPATLHIETVVREDALLLYGFRDTAERDWFRLLQTVQGVGGRVALALLSVLTPDQLVQAIASGDKNALARADGVGPKLAVRLLTELKDKVAGLALGAMARTAPSLSPAIETNGTVEAEAVSALVNLGYGRSDAFTVVVKLAQQQRDGGAEPALADLIRAGLKALSPA